jgi:hypothetical protein
VLQEGGKTGLVLLQALLVQGPAQMFGVAAQGRGAEAELLGQGAIGHAPDEQAVDLGALGVIADSATFIHWFPVPSFQFSVKASGKGYQGRGQGASSVGTVGRRRVKKEKFTLILGYCIFYRKN